MSLADRIRKLEIEAGGHLIAIPQPDGSVERFHEDAVMDAMLSSYDRGRAKLAGEEEVLRGEAERPGPAVRWNGEGTVCE